MSDSIIDYSIKDLPCTDYNEFIEDSKNNNSCLTLICFTASWCEPCKKLKTYLQNLNQQILNNDIYKNKVKIFKINIEDEDYSEFIENYNISKIPDLVFIKSGMQIMKMIGTKEMETIPEKIKLFLS